MHKSVMDQIESIKNRLKEQSTPEDLVNLGLFKSTSALAMRRSRKQMPEYIKFGNKSIFYSKEAVLKWLTITNEISNVKSDDFEDSFVVIEPQKNLFVVGGFNKYSRSYDIYGSGNSEKTALLEALASISLHQKAFDDAMRKNGSFESLADSMLPIRKEVIMKNNYDSELEQENAYPGSTDIKINAFRLNADTQRWITFYEKDWMI